MNSNQKPPKATEPVATVRVSKARMFFRKIWWAIVGAPKRHRLPGGNRRPFSAFVLVIIVAVTLFSQRSSIAGYFYQPTTTPTTQSENATSTQAVTPTPSLEPSATKTSQAAVFTPTEAVTATNTPFAATPTTTPTQSIAGTTWYPVPLNASDKVFELNGVCYYGNPAWTIFVLKSGYHRDCAEGAHPIRISELTIIPRDMAVVPSERMGFNAPTSQATVGRTITPSEEEGVVKICAVNTTLIKSHKFVYSRQIVIVGEAINFDGKDVKSFDLLNCYLVSQDDVHQTVLSLITQANSWLDKVEHEGYYQIILPQTYQGLWHGLHKSAVLP